MDGLCLSIFEQKWRGYEEKSEKSRFLYKKRSFGTRVAFHYI